MVVYGYNPEMEEPARVCSPPEGQGAEEPHHSVYCPNCSSRLEGHRCKLICRGCGYYLSCADYY